MTELAEDGLTGQKVLLVEDDVLVGITLRGGLEELGANVSWSTSLDGALDAVQSGEAIDIAIVDVNLAGQMSTPLLDLLITMDIYTVICTGYDESSLEERFRYLPRCEKPFTRAKLRRYLVDRN